MKTEKREQRENSEFTQILKVATEKFESDPRAQTGEVKYISFDDGPTEVHDVILTSEENEAVTNFKRIKDLRNQHGGSQFSSFHNHRYGKEEIEHGMGSIPSRIDFLIFLFDDAEKNMIIAQQDKETGKVVGYYVFSKTESTPKANCSLSDELSGCATKEEIEKKSEEVLIAKFRDSTFDELTWDYKLKAFGEFSHNKPPAERQEAIDELLQKANLDVKYVPLEGYEYVSGTGFFPKQNG